MRINLQKNVPSPVVQEILSIVANTRRFENKYQVRRNFKFIVSRSLATVHNIRSVFQQFLVPWVEVHNKSENLRNTFICDNIQLSDVNESL